VRMTQYLLAKNCRFRNTIQARASVFMHRNHP
jgi:hypothetical protein